MKRTLCKIIAFAMLVSLAAGCNTNTASPSSAAAPASSAASSQAASSAAESKVDEKDLPVLRLGTLDSRAGFTLWYICENGMDVENGFKIEASNFNSGAPINEALGAGLVDIIQIGSPAAVNSAAVYGAKILATTSEGAGGLNLFVRPDSAIAQAGNGSDKYPAVIGSADTVKGAQIMYPVGTMAQIGVGRYLEAFGLTLDDVTSVNMDYGSAYQAFKAGEGDIVATFSPANYTALGEGYIKVGTLFDMQVPMYDVIAANKDTYEANKEIITKLIALVYQVNDMMTADRDLQLNTLKEYHKSHGVEVADDMLPIELETMYLMTSEKAKTIELGISIMQTAEFYVEIGTLEPDKLDVIKSCIDPTISNEVLK